MKFMKMHLFDEISLDFNRQKGAIFSCCQEGKRKEKEEEKGRKRREEREEKKREKKERREERKGKEGKREGRGKEGGKREETGHDEEPFWRINF